MEIAKTISNDFFRLFDILDYQVARYPNDRAFNYNSHGKWKSMSIQQFQKHVDALSCWFIESGFKKGDKIIIVPVLATPHWMLIDFACQQIGIIVVPIHSNWQSHEINTILKEIEPKLCLTANPDLCQSLQLAANSVSIASGFFHLTEGHPQFFEPIRSFELKSKSLEKIKALKEGIAEKDITTILYTSGSSGDPKGVMLSHRNIVHNIKALLAIIPLEPKQKVMTFLPFSHILERTACYSYLAFGVSLYFSQSKETFVSDFKSVKPYFCTAVPRVLEKMYDFLQEQVLSKNWIKRKLISWALEKGKKFGDPRYSDFLSAIDLFLARTLVLSHWRKVLGGKIRYMAVGGAALRPEIGRLFNAAGIRVVEGYGMTETAPLIAINRFDPGLNRVGTVGLAVPGVSIRIADANEEGEGEIQVTGPNIMMGYYKKEDATRNAFTDDGWFKTGDVGKLVESHFLKITDRKKEIFKTSAGKYIAPLFLQNHLSKSPFIQRCLIIGFQRPFVTALVVPNFTALEAWCNREHIHWTAAQFMVHNIKVRALLEREIEILNEDVPGFMRIRDFVLCHEEWTQESGEVTTTLKPVRNVIEEHYRSQIEKMYA